MSLIVATVDYYFTVLLYGLNIVFELYLFKLKRVKCLKTNRQLFCSKSLT